MTTINQGNIKMAIASLRSTKWRSLLTMLGIVIGVVSVVTVVAIGEGIKHQVGSQINQLGRDLITVRPGQLVQRSQTGAISGVALFPGATTGGSLSNQDLQTVRNTDGVQQAVPLGLVSGSVSSDKRNTNVPVIATTSELPAILNQGLAFGSFYGSDVTDQPNVAIVGYQAAYTMFGEHNVPGHSFNFLGQNFVVRGVFNQFDTSPLSFSTDFNNAIFIPYSTAESLTQNNLTPYEILAKPSDPTSTSSIVGNISATLRQKHQYQQRFTILQQDESLAVTNNILDLLTKLVAGVAAISLLVGGVGIMDVMLVSVAERMHEIGIRKALGATNQQILGQFMMEATVLSLTGGIIGILIAFLVDYLLHVFTDLTPYISWQVVLLATFVSLMVGVVFGSIPALKAARKDPIDALRND
ncbi:MAG TPA: ABC transporter permease [Candidatus Saccharimonadales bacterium]|nr:ABC transporter permease [Candidatus Saccharimonadales bacterium]